MSYTEPNIPSWCWNNAIKGIKIYFDLAETSFKAQFASYNKDFNYELYKKSTELSKYIWSLKDVQITSRIRWSSVEKVYGRTKINFCPLCLAEKLHLIEHFNDNRLLNERNEFISGCRHRLISPRVEHLNEITNVRKPKSVYIYVYIYIYIYIYAMYEQIN